MGEYTVPDPAPGTVLLRQELCGICGTDIHNWLKGIEPATMLGHENVGIIEALGKGLTTDFNGTPDQRGGPGGLSSSQQRHDLRLPPCG